MSFMRYGILAALAIAPAFAQIPNSLQARAQEAEVMSPIQHAPMRLHELPTRNGSVTSENWSGYAVTGSDFTNAAGSWIVPKVDCTTTPNSYSAFWVGIDGYSSTTVEQTGTISYCSAKTAAYYAWYEFYPEPSFDITSVPVVPGDKISASVTYNGSEFTTVITNETTGKTFTKSAKVAGALRSSAEWIAEAPCCTTSGGILPLSDFDIGEFGDDYTDVASTNYATNSSVTGPISDFGSDIEAITMVSSKGTTEAVVTKVSTDGSSFRVGWKSE